jgi:tRNA-Thr(GGU) m(6)t(6)A37 methyltransferase TsaA
VAARVVYEPIGVVHSPFTTLEGMPLQAVAAMGVRGRIEVDAAYEPGLRDLDGFSHVHLITHLHRASLDALEVVPFLDDVPRGVFATRSPQHPNPIGLSVVRVLGIEGATIRVEGLDVVDGTPVLDLKPFVPEFDNRDPERIGWFADKTELVYRVRADARFTVDR